MPNRRAGPNRYREELRVFLTRFCLSNPIAVTLFYVFIGVAGLLGLARMGRSILPPVAFPIVAVSAPYPGAAPSEIERLVIEPIEDQLDALPDVDRVSASAQAGLAQLSIRFRFGTDLAGARANVRQAVAAAAAVMPADIVPPLVSPEDLGRSTVLDEAIGSAVLSPAELSAIVARTVVPALRATAGVGAVQVSGQLTRQFTVEPRAGPLDALGATALDLYRAVGKSNDIFPGGAFTTATQQASIAVRSAAVSAAALGAFPLTIATGPAAVRIRDVARVTDGYADRAVISRVDAAPSIVLFVTSAPNSDARTTIAAARATFTALSRALPLVRFMQLRTDEPATRAALDGVLQTLMEGIVLTALVMLAFLRMWRDAAIAAVAIPASLCAAFATMWASGLTVNVLSLMGLSLTIGILVDDSIVIIEAIARCAQRGLSSEAAALAGRRELGAAAFAITFVDVAVFFPIALMRGLIGEFMREFGLVIVIATSFSLFVSFTLTPLLAARWAARARSTARPPKILPGTLRSKPVRRAVAAVRAANVNFARFEGDLTTHYARRWLPVALRHPNVTFAIVAVACALGFAPVALGGIPTEFSPPINRGQVTADLTFPAGTTLAAVDTSVARLAGALLDDAGIKHVVTSAGRSFNGIGDTFASNRAQVTVVFRDPAAAGSAVIERMKNLANLVPGATIAGAGTGMGGRAPVSYNLAGDAVAVAEVTRRIAAVLAANGSATDVRTSDGGLGPRLEIAIDPAKALLLGVVPDDAAQTARLATGGTIATKVRLDAGLVDVVVRGSAAQRGDLDVLRRTGVRSADGRLIPLGAVATIVQRFEPSVIERENRERIATVSANMRAGAPIGPVIASVDAAMRRPGFLPANVRIAARGDVEQFRDTVARIGAALALSVGVVYAILAILYRSYALPLVIMTTVPLAAFGAFGSLYTLNVLGTVFPNTSIFSGQTLNLYSMLGIVMLVGLVAKNGILLVEYAERAVRDGAAPSPAMCEAAQRRFRPIIMTTVAMIAGMLPLAFGETIGAEYRKALGTVVIGGLSSSLFLTLFIVPVAYVGIRRTAHAPGGSAPIEVQQSIATDQLNYL